MPTLTDEQALARYRAILAREGIAPNRHLDHSALYQRLKRGQRALTYPPPLAHSYPWYEVIEVDSPLAIDEPKAWHFPDATDQGEMMVIFQTLWTVVARNNNRLQLTYPRWQDIGMEWEVWREWTLADQAGAKLLCHHAPQKGILRTEQDLDLEAAYHVQRWCNALTIVASASDDTDALSALEAMASKGNTRHRWFEKAYAQQTLERTREELMKRAQAGLSEHPDRNEIDARCTREKRSLMGEDWEVREGQLGHNGWWIQRITPKALTDRIYLDSKHLLTS